MNHDVDQVKDEITSKDHTLVKEHFDMIMSMGEHSHRFAESLTHIAEERIRPGYSPDGCAQTIRITTAGNGETMHT